jgi:hypothetical protein
VHLHAPLETCSSQQSGQAVAEVGASPISGMSLLAGLGEPLPHLKDCIYLDYNATTPIWPQVRAACAVQHWVSSLSRHTHTPHPAC